MWFLPLPGLLFAALDERVLSAQIATVSAVEVAPRSPNVAQIACHLEILVLGVVLAALFNNHFVSQVACLDHLPTALVDNLG